MNPSLRLASLCATLMACLVTPALAAPHAGDDAPAFTLPKASGGTLSLANFKGKPVYLNFFASWCAPCNEEAGTVGALYKKYHPKGLQTVGVDEQEDAGKALGFAQKYKWPFGIGVDGGDMGKNYGLVALPVHVFVDKHGKISTYRLGEMAPSEIEDAIKKIVAS